MARRSMRTPKIMLIDDSELVLDVVGATLRDAGYDVVTRSVPIGAGAHIVRERPDVVLLDVSMPLMSGAEISGAVRKSSLARGICILLHSDRAAPELAELVERCGANGYIRKGSDPARLVAEVQGWVERARAGALGPGKAKYGFITCGPRTRARLEKELVAAIPLRYSDSSAEALRHVCSSEPPAIVVVGTSRVDISCLSVFRAACRSHPSWQRRFGIIDETGAPVIEGSELADVPRWSSERPVSELSILIGRLIES